MAVNQIIECVLGTKCALTGKTCDATAFTPVDIDGAIATLAEHGIEYGGSQRMYNGYTGDWLDCKIFIGPTTYQRLAKFVVDEYYAIERGATHPVTHQPLEGKTRDGGLRLGEMEKDCYCNHGAAEALYEKFSSDSDGTTIYICRRCGQRAVVNPRKNLVICRECDSKADVCAIPSTWSASLFLNELTGMGVGMTFEIEPPAFPVKGTTGIMPIIGINGTLPDMRPSRQ
jgi:DNA-directed RNA polymerase II subunit RPB2